MRFFVYLDTESAAGRIYQHGPNDGVGEGWVCLQCVKLDFTHPLYLVAIRRIDADGHPHQYTIHVPHNAVAFVHAQLREGLQPHSFGKG